MMNGHPDLPVCESDFGSPPNRTIYSCLMSLTNRALLAVQAELQRRGQLETVGGRAGLTEISCLQHDAANVAYALDEVLEASRRRDAIKIGKELVSSAITPEKAQEQLAQLSQRRDCEKSWDDALSESVVTANELHGLNFKQRKKLLG